VFLKLLQPRVALHHLAYHIHVMHINAGKKSIGIRETNRYVNAMAEDTGGVEVQSLKLFLGASKPSI
jgi:hypothetical protein